MSDDARQLLHNAAPSPARRPDVERLWARGRRRRHAARTGAVMTALAAVVAIVTVVPGLGPDSGMGLEVADQPAGACPVTEPGATPLTPPEPHVFADPGIDGAFWYGTPELWTVVSDPAGPQKSVWWSADFDGSGEDREPDIQVVYQRLDDPDAEAIVFDGPGTNAFTDEQGWFMIAGIQPDEPGCWQATATYRDAELTIVYRIEDVTERAPGTTDPSEGFETIVGPPVAIVSSTEPFDWAVAVSPGDNGSWCDTTTRLSTFLGDATGRRCTQLTAPDPEDSRGFGSGMSQVTNNPDGTPAEGISWGLAPAAADEVMVLFADGSRVPAELADVATGEGRLWAVGYLDAEIVAVEARAEDAVLAGDIPSTTVPASGPVVSPQEAFGDRLERAQLKQFSDDAPAVFDLRADDELYSLGPPSSWRAVGIRVRDGFAPLMWATDCDGFDSELLPEGWLGLCREYTDSEAGQVSGLFPHSTTSVTVDPRGLEADPELTDQFIAAFTACLTEQGIDVDRVDAIVTEGRELQLLGWAASGDDPPGADSAGTDCENAQMNELELRPYVN